MERKAFLDQKPPPGYIPGIGRGATGFATSGGFRAPNRVPVTSAIDGVSETDADQFKDADKPNEISVHSYDKEDLEADKIYDDLEKYLEKKKTKRRKLMTDDKKDKIEDKLVARDESLSSSINEISKQFQEVKNELAAVTPEQWENLPESGDFTRKNKRLREELQQNQRFYRNSDMIALGLKNAGATDSALDYSNVEVDENVPDDKDNDGNVNLLEISRTKEKLLENQLRIGNQKKINEFDKSAYLEKLAPSASQYNIGDYKRTRKLFAKLRENNPTNPQNWIASAKLELDANKIKRAKEIIQEGCEKFPKFQEIWLTSLEIHKDDIPVSKVIVADAIRYHHKSVRLWIKAAELEQDRIYKVRVLRKALELNPDSEDLWLEITKHEKDTEVCIKMLEKATSLVPQSVRLWEALASLQKPTESMKILISSTEVIRKESVSSIWLKIAEIEEKHSSNELKIAKYVSKSFETAGECPLHDWIMRAELSEDTSHELTCRAIIYQALENTSEDFNTLIALSEKKLENNHFITADSILMFITSRDSSNEKAWNALFKLKRDNGDYKGLFLAYELAISANPENPDIYLDYLNDRLKYDTDTGSIRTIISSALNAIPASEKLWLFAISFESRCGTQQVCQDLFDFCMKTLKEPTIDIWVEKIRFERRLQDLSAAQDSINKALNKFPDSPSLYMEKANLLDSLGRLEESKQTLYDGITNCKNNDMLFIALADLYFEKLNNILKARSVLDQALACHSKCEKLHHSRIKLEMKSGNKDHAKRLLFKALNLVPTSPLLWSDNIRLATKQQLKNMYVLALKKTNDDPLIILTIAKDLWKSGKMDRANQFFKACLEKDPKLGDAYIFYYAFLLANGSRDEMKALESQAVENLSLHGRRWEFIVDHNRYRDVPELQLLREAAVDVSKLNH